MILKPFLFTQSFQTFKMTAELNDAHGHSLKEKRRKRSWRDGRKGRGESRRCWGHKRQQLLSVPLGGTSYLGFLSSA